MNELDKDIVTLNTNHTDLHHEYYMKAGIVTALLFTKQGQLRDLYVVFVSGMDKKLHIAWSHLKAYSHLICINNNK